MEEINEDREERNNKPFDRGKKDNKKTIVIGFASDPDCGVFHSSYRKISGNKGSRRGCFT